VEIRIDQNGKYFTPHTSKDPLLTVVHTAGQLIVGTVYASVDRRLKDEINTIDERFLAITDARVYTVDAGKFLYTSQLVLVAYAQIIMISPADAIDQSELSWVNGVLKESP
jgi:hypothetical protein